MTKWKTGMLEMPHSFNMTTNTSNFTDSPKALVYKLRRGLDILPSFEAMTSSSSSVVAPQTKVDSPIIESIESSVTIPNSATIEGKNEGKNTATQTIPGANPSQIAVGNGLRAEYYQSRDFTNLKLTRTDGTINFDWGTGSPDVSISPNDFSVRWTGKIKPRYSETYTFYTRADDGVRLWVNGQLLINDWNNHPLTENSAAIALNAGQAYDIRLEYYEGTSKAASQLLWSSPSQAKEIIPQSYLFSGASIVEAATVGERARSAYSFIDSIGINTHLNYYDTPYGNYSLIERSLLKLGVRHIRDGASDPTWVDRINWLGKQGIKATLILDPNNGTGPNAAYDIRSPGYDVKRFVRDIVPAGVEAVEILNEFDFFRNNGYRYNGQPVIDANWVNYLRNFTRDTFNALNSDPATENIAVIGPSFIYPNSSTLMGNLSQWVDYGNLHPYSYPKHPGNGNLAQDMATRSLPFANRPLIATETGYHTGGPASDRPVSEAVHGKYVPRMFLENFNQGIYRTFAYELIDEWNNPNNREANFGLLRNDGTPKPAFTALQNLISVLKDSGTPFNPGTLDYFLSGNTQNVRHTLLQKSNGEFYLVMWLEVPSTDVAVSQSVTLTVNTPIEQATTYLTNQSANPVEKYISPTQLTLNLQDSPLVVELSPKSSVV